MNTYYKIRKKYGCLMEVKKNLCKLFLKYFSSEIRVMDSDPALKCFHIFSRVFKRVCNLFFIVTNF